jgi:hypothetical protein
MDMYVRKSTHSSPLAQASRDGRKHADRPIVSQYANLARLRGFVRGGDLGPIVEAIKPSRSEFLKQ